MVIFFLPIWSHLPHLDNEISLGFLNCNFHPPPPPKKPKHKITMSLCNSELMFETKHHDVDKTKG